MVFKAQKIETETEQKWYNLKDAKGIANSVDLLRAVRSQPSESAMSTQELVMSYRNVPKFLEQQVWANSVDPDETAVWSRSTLI